MFLDKLSETFVDFLESYTDGGGQRRPDAPAGYITGPAVTNLNDTKPVTRDPGSIPNVIAIAPSRTMEKFITAHFFVRVRSYRKVIGSLIKVRNNSLLD